MTTLSEAAFAYLDAGYHLLALHHKRPNDVFHEQWDYQNSIHGHPETDEDRQGVERVFTHRSTTGIALLIPENVLVADIDSEAAAELYMSLAGALPETAVAKTKNGLHAWFLAPGADGSMWLGNRVLLFKGFGGYVAAPPSKHFDERGVEDGVYTWLEHPDAGIDWLPPKIDALLKERRTLGTFEKPDLFGTAERAYIEVEFYDGGWRLWKRWDIKGLCQAIIDAPDGNQNNVILWAALTAQEEGVPLEVAMDQLLAAAIQGGHPARRARTTISGVYKRRRNR